MFKLFSSRGKFRGGNRGGFGGRGRGFLRGRDFLTAADVSEVKYESGNIIFIAEQFE